MAKKKTKTKASLLVAAAINARKGADEIDDAVDSVSDTASNDIETHNDVITMRLKSTIGKSSTLHKQPRIIMTAVDAIHLNLCVGDNVIIVSLNDNVNNNDKDDKNSINPKIHDIVILPVEIYNDKQPANHVASPVILPRQSKHQLLPGTVQLTSSALLEDLTSWGDKPYPKDLRTKESPTAEEMTPKQSQATTPFSFKSFVSSPPSSAIRTPGSSSSRKGSSKNDCSNMHDDIKVIACRTEFGKSILKARTVICTKLIVQPTITDSSLNNIDNTQTDHLQMHSLSTASIRTLEQLMHAHMFGSFVKIGQHFSISFTGKPFRYSIVSAESEQPYPNSMSTNHEGILDADFSRLSIEDNIPIDNLSTEAQSLYPAILQCNLQLYSVLRSTKITFYKKSIEQVEVCSDEEKEEVDVRPMIPIQYVAGLSTTLDELRSLLITPLTRPELFARRGMKAPKGVLLHGPNGVGKTCLAKQFIQEMAINFKCPVRYVHCASLQSKADVVGEAESALKELFRPVDTGCSSLLVLDDIHLICSKRGSGGSSQGMDRLAATLLALMDGIESMGSSSVSSSLGNVAVLAITTNPSVLDPALRRPGRIDSEIEVPLPEDAFTRAEILQFHISSFDIPLGNDLIDQSTFLDVAKAAKGYNGADCMLAVKEAIRLAMLDATEADPCLRKNHLLTAMRYIKPSAIKSITVEIPQVLWSSIGGMESVKQDLREAIELPLSHSEIFDQLRVPPPRGILLYGPPGCSKTLMARALATEGNMNFLAVKGPELLSKWLGESERALSSLFRRARMASPAIVFFDEIDAIASKRGSGDSASSGRLLSQLLTELDGVNNTTNSNMRQHKTKQREQRVVIVGATNRPDLLDTALTRPGRIDRMIYVGPPDASSRAQILQINLQKASCSPDIDLSVLASDTVSGGFSGAEMVAICRDAALLALEECDNNITTTNNVDDIVPMIEMRHLLVAIRNMHKQITPSMINFYQSYQDSYKKNKL